MLCVQVQNRNKHWFNVICLHKQKQSMASVGGLEAGQVCPQLLPPSHKGQE